MFTLTKSLDIILDFNEQVSHFKDEDLSEKLTFSKFFLYKLFIVDKTPFSYDFFQKK